MSNLAGKIAWVTGAGSGIGEAAALALAREGATVVLTGRRRAPLEAAAKTIGERGGTAFVEAADVTDKAAVRAAAAAIDARHGRLDIVVNNAGTNIPDRRWARLTQDGIDTLIQGNLTSAFYVVQAALPIMRRAG